MSGLRIFNLLHSERKGAQLEQKQIADFTMQVGSSWVPKGGGAAGSLMRKAGAASCCRF